MNNTGFTKLLNNFMNRIDEEKASKTVNSEHVDLTDEDSPVRIKIKNIIEEKMKQNYTKDGAEELEDKSSRTQEKVLHENLDDSSEGSKSQILFSLKDFFERSTSASPTHESEPATSADEKGNEEVSEDESLSSGDEFKESDIINENVEQEQRDSDVKTDEESDVEIQDVDDSVETLNEVNDSVEIIDEVKEEKAENKKNEKQLNDEKETLFTAPNDGIRVHSKGHSDLEEDLSLLDKLKRNLDKNLTNSSDKPKTPDINVHSSIFQSKNIVIEKVSNNSHPQFIRRADKSKQPESSNKSGGGGIFKKKEILIEKVGNAKDNQSSRPSNENLKSRKTGGIFSNVSISVLGKGSKTIDVETLLKEKSSKAKIEPDTKASNETNNVFTSRPNLTVKRKTVPNQEKKTYKRTKKTSNLLNSDDEDMSNDSYFTVTLDEKAMPEDALDTDTAERSPSEYDNCVHGELADYMCVDCTYKRWRYEYNNNQKKPTEVQKIDGLNEEEIMKNHDKTKMINEDPTKIMEAINWQQVFSFANVKPIPSVDAS